MSKKEIICVSTASYLPFPSRKQNVMSRLKDVEVIYIDPPVSYLAPLKDPKAKEKLKAYKAPGNPVRDNITVYTAPPVLPFFNKYRILNRLNQKRLSKRRKKPRPRMPMHPRRRTHPNPNPPTPPRRSRSLRRRNRSRSATASLRYS